MDDKNKNNENNVDTQLELLKYATQVQSRINDITSDFTLCKLEIHDKEGVTNMVVNAYVAKRKIMEISKKAKWTEWNGNKWTTNTDIIKKAKIRKLAEKAFDMYMTKVFMTTVLNRNVDKNYLVNMLKNQQEIETPEEIESTEKRIKNRIIKDKNEETK